MFQDSEDALAFEVSQQVREVWSRCFELAEEFNFQPHTIEVSRCLWTLTSYSDHGYCTKGSTWVLRTESYGASLWCVKRTSEHHLVFAGDLEDVRVHLDLMLTEVDIW